MRWLAISLVLAAGAAHANGRAPLTNGIRFQPGDLHSLYVASTFGLLVSHDDGCTFRWVCEANVRYGGTFDPKYAIATDGTLFATTYNGLRVSRDGGCSFTTATADLPQNDPGNISMFWIDALDIGPTGEVWVGTATSGQPNDVFVSTDNGSTFASRGMLSPTIWWKSVKVAPSRAQRVYITGYEVAGTGSGGMMPIAHLFASDDDGATWTPSQLAGVQTASTPVVLVEAVDPRNADVLYVASVGANGALGDFLYRSSDGGATLAQVLAAGGTIHDVVIADAQTVFVTTTIASGTTVIGGPSYVSHDGGATFAPLANSPQLACLGQRGDGMLVGCGANWDPDHMAVATSPDLGATWQKLWRFVNLAGPLDCPPGTDEHDVCAVQQWPNLQQQFATTGPTCGAFVVDGAADATVPVKKRGCCEAGGAAPPLLPLLLLLPIPLLKRWRRRR